MFEKLDVLSYLKERGSILNDNNLNKLPDEHKNTSLESGAKCDLSYHQGYRDGIQSLLTIINISWHDEYNAMEQETEHMYLDFLQNKCLKVFLSLNKHMSEEELNTDYLKSWSKSACINFLKEQGKWEE